LGLSTSKCRKSLVEGDICVIRSDERAHSLYLTVDVEESFNWETPGSECGLVSDVEDIKVFHLRCKNIGISPVYLITYRMLSDNEFNEFFVNAQKNGECELGVHLHSWNTPPIGVHEPSFQCSLPIALERQKLITIIDRFETIFGFKPVVHRAGRYGIDYETYSLLSDLNINVDLSPSAGFDFSEKGGPSFVGLTNKLFTRRYDETLICLPVPSINFSRGPDWFHCYKQFFRRIFKPQPVRLTPEGNSVERMRKITKSLIKQNVKDIVVTVHSTSFSHGANPYSKELNSNLALIEDTFTYIDWCLNSTELKCSTIQKLYDELHGNKEVNCVGYTRKN